MVAFLLSLFFVQEHFKPVAHHREPGDSRNPLAAFQNPRLIIVMLCSTAIVQFGNASIAPIISLYVRELMHYRGPRYFAVCHWDFRWRTISRDSNGFD